MADAIREGKTDKERIALIYKYRWDRGGFLPDAAQGVRNRFESEKNEALKKLV